MLNPFWLLLGGLSYPLQLSPGSFPRALTAQEERTCLFQARQGSLEARNKLIEHNLRLVAHITKKYYAQTADREDLISIGTVGLIKAVSTFNPQKGTRLATYAARCIENEILMYFRSQRKSAQDVSLSDLLDTGGEGAALSLMDVVGQEQDMAEALAGKELACQLHRAMEKCLTQQEQLVISLRYGLTGDAPLRQREVAQAAGISRSYVSRIEKRALEKLRRALD